MLRQRGRYGGVNWNLRDGSDEVSEHEGEEKAGDPVPPEKNAGTPEIKDAMSEAEIRAAGLAIDVPYESGEAKPERLKYADLGEEYRWSGKMPDFKGVKARTTDDDVL